MNLCGPAVIETGRAVKQFESGCPVGGSHREKDADSFSLIHHLSS